MKKITLFSILAAFVAALSFTSCNTDSDSDSQALSAAQIQQCYLATHGNHYGKMVYYAENKANVKDKQDTVSVSWNITTDSTMTIYGIPAKVIAERIQFNNELKEAIEKQPEITLNCKIQYATVNPIQFYIGPDNINYTLNYGGKEHKFEMRFYWGYPSIGQYSPDSKKPMLLQLVAPLLKIDGNETSYGITSSTPLQLLFYTEK